MDDTSYAARARYLELLRAMPPAARLEQAARLSRATRALCEAGVRSRHPGSAEREVQARVAAITYGAAVAARFFPEVTIDEL